MEFPEPDELFVESFNVHAHLPAGRAKGVYSGVGRTQSERLRNCLIVAKEDYPDAYRILVAVPS